jgi:hypothetical protein
MRLLLRHLASQLLLKLFQVMGKLFVQLRLLRNPDEIQE